MSADRAAEPATAREAMIVRPTRHPATLTVVDARAALEDPHVHLLLLVDGDRLVGTLTRDDLLQSAADDAPARDLARLSGRTVAPDVDVEPLLQDMVQRGRRRLAVVDDDGDLLGLLCLKRSGAGFCSDAGVAARSAARRAAETPGA